MKTLFLVFAVAFLVFQVRGNANPEEADAKELEGGAHPRSALVCRTVGGNCRQKCYSNEVSVGQCLPNVFCCQGFQ